MQDTPVRRKPEPVGPFVGIIIVIALLLVGGVYFFLTQQEKLRQAPPLEYSDQA